MLPQPSLSLLRTLQNHQRFKLMNLKLYETMVQKMLVDVWEECPSSGDSKLARENIETCTKLAEYIVNSLEHVISFIRLLASKDDCGNFRCAPAGKIKLQKTALFSYAVLKMGMKVGEDAYMTMQRIATGLKNFKMYQLVLANLYRTLESY